MSRIRPTWTPESLDAVVQAHVLGFDFSADIPVTISGIWWYQPATGGPASVTARLHDQATQALLASGTGSGLTAGAWNLIPLAAAYAGQPGVTYTAAVGSTGSTGYDGNDLLADIVDPTGHVRALAGQGRFINGTTTAFPTNTWSGMHGVDVEFTPAVAIQGATALSATAALAAAGTLVRFGAVVLSARGVLAAQASGATVIPGVLAAAGTAPTLTAAGSTPTLAAAGGQPVLTATGTP